MKLVSFRQIVDVLGYVDNFVLFKVVAAIKKLNKNSNNKNYDL